MSVAVEELFEEAPCGYVIAAPDGALIRVNKRFAAWLGREPASFRDSEKFQSLLTIPGRIYYDTHLLPLLRMQGHFRGVALDLERAGQEPLPVIVDCELKLDPQNRPQLLRMTIVDVTDRRTYERELLLARKRQGRADPRGAEHFRLEGAGVRSTGFSSP